MDATFPVPSERRGTAGFVMANGAMTTNNTGEKDVRQKLVDEGYIDCIVQLPEKLFLQRVFLVVYSS